MLIDLQDRKRVVLELLNLGVPARCGIAGRIAPRVVVEREKVAALVVGSTVHVVSGIIAVRFNISGGISDRDGSELAVALVLLHITGDGLYIRSGLGGGKSVVDDLVSGEESKGIIVLGEHFHGGEDVLEVLVVVRWVGVLAIDGVLGAVHVEDEVDAGIVEHLHASIMVGSIVDGIDADRVDTQLLELCNVTLAGRLIRQRIDEV